MKILKLIAVCLICTHVIGQNAKKPSGTFELWRFNNGTDIALLLHEKPTGAIQDKYGKVKKLGITYGPTMPLRGQRKIKTKLQLTDPQNPNYVVYIVNKETKELPKIDSDTYRWVSISELFPTLSRPTEIPNNKVIISVNDTFYLDQQFLRALRYDMESKSNGLIRQALDDYDTDADLTVIPS